MANLLSAVGNWWNQPFVWTNGLFLALVLVIALLALLLVLADWRFELKR